MPLNDETLTLANGDEETLGKVLQRVQDNVHVLKTELDNTPEPTAPVPVVQTTGQSTTDVMSQKAVTDELKDKANTNEVLELVTTAVSYYVNASTGNDANAGTSAQTAFQTLDKALEQISGKNFEAGCTVMLNSDVPTDHVYTIPVYGGTLSLVGSLSSDYIIGNVYCRFQNHGTKFSLRNLVFNATSTLPGLDIGEMANCTIASSRFVCNTENSIGIRANYVSGLLINDTLFTGNNSGSGLSASWSNVSLYGNTTFTKNAAAWIPVTVSGSTVFHGTAVVMNGTNSSSDKSIWYSIINASRVFFADGSQLPEMPLNDSMQNSITEIMAEFETGFFKYREILVTGTGSDADVTFVPAGTAGSVKPAYLFSEAPAADPPDVAEGDIAVLTHSATSASFLVYTDGFWEQLGTPGGGITIEDGTIFSNKNGEGWYWFEGTWNRIDTGVEGLQGGTTGQVLAKKSDADNDFEWQDPAGGGASTVMIPRAKLSATEEVLRNWSGNNNTSHTMTKSGYVQVQGVYSNSHMIYLAVNSVIIFQLQFDRLGGSYSSASPWFFVKSGDVVLASTSGGTGKLVYRPVELVPYTAAE
ncbi:MAG: hypothetical protein LBQ54_02220 [Planctomycetaceae bacterium]|jgi:hypothetical protein|nr:hypothetical protein [Planctomycetaceae bacterium]